MCSFLKILLFLFPVCLFGTEPGHVNIVNGRVTITAGRVAIGPQTSPITWVVAYSNGFEGWDERARVTTGGAVWITNGAERSTSTIGVFTNFFTSPNRYFPYEGLKTLLLYAHGGLEANANKFQTGYLTNNISLGQADRPVKVRFHSARLVAATENVHKFAWFVSYADYPSTDFSSWESKGTNLVTVMANDTNWYEQTIEFTVTNGIYHLGMQFLYSSRQYFMFDNLIVEHDSP